MGSVFVQSKTGLTIVVFRIPPLLYLRTKNKFYLGCRVLGFSPNRVRPLLRGACRLPGGTGELCVERPRFE